MKALRIVLTASLMLIGLGAFAQNISGVLLDESNGDPLGFATVSLTREGSSKPNKYVLSGEKGTFKLESVRNGVYTLKAELLGYKEYSRSITVKDKDINLGELKLNVDSEQLAAAEVAALANPVVIKKDTIEYNAAAFATTENDVLEDLLKKLPGVEVSESGTISINGESVSKITIDGKTFFLNDPQMASRNIPAKLVKKLKVIKKKSEQAEFSGIDDGNEETVIDLSVQPGMMKGLFGNVNAGAGRDLPPQKGVEADTRFQGNLFAGHFTQDHQISLVLGGNNTNQRMSGGMGGMRGGGGGFGGGGNGITTSYMAGVNGAWTLFDDKMNVGGNYVYNTSDRESENYSSRTNFLQGSSIINNSSSLSSTNSDGHTFGMRLDHKFSNNTSILFEPQLSFGNTVSASASRDTTFRGDAEGLNAIKTAESQTENSSNARSVSTSGRFLFRQRLGLPGRTLTANINYSLSDNETNGLNQNSTTSFVDDYVTKPSVNQSYVQNQNSYSVGTRVTYTEPLGGKYYLEAHYAYSWNKSVSDKETIDLNTGLIDYTYSNEIVNENRNQDFGLTALMQDSKFSAQIGFSAKPNYTYNRTSKYDELSGGMTYPEYEDNRWNYSPDIMIRMNPNDKWNLRFNYRGNSSQPSTSQLMPVPDNTNPMRMSFGNPTLTPYFSHNVSSDIRFSNRQNFTSFNFRVNGGMVQNPIITANWYAPNGAQYTMPFNGPARMNAGANFFASIPIGKSKFSISESASGNWSQSSSYVGTNIDMTTYDESGYYDFMNEFIDKFNDPSYFAAHIGENTNTNISANENFSIRYRGTALSGSLGASTRMNKTWYTITGTSQNQGMDSQTLTWNNAISANINWNWALTGMSFSSDFNYNWYNGYQTEQPSRSILNAEISKMILKKTATLALRANDILGQSKALNVTDEANYHTESISNTLGRYVILSFTYRFGSIGRGGRGGMRGGMGGGMRGGMGGGRPF